MSTESERVAHVTERALAGNLAKGADKLAEQGKLFVRDRLARLLDDGSFVEDGLLANALAENLPADGVVTGVGRVDGRPVCVMANDSTVKAGSWGARTVEKIVRLTEHALRHEMPVVYLVDSAGARITDQVELFPGRRRRPDLREPGAAVGTGPAGLLPVRAVGRRRCVHPRVLRRRVHGRGQRIDVPRLAAHGRDGDRRARLARGDGRRAHARDRQRLRRQPVRDRRRRDRRGPALSLLSPELVGRGLAAGGVALPPRGASRSATSCPRRSGARTTCTG